MYTFSLRTRGDSCLVQEGGCLFRLGPPPPPPALPFRGGKPRRAWVVSGEGLVVRLCLQGIDTLGAAGSGWVPQRAVDSNLSFPQPTFWVKIFLGLGRSEPKEPPASYKQSVLLVCTMQILIICENYKFPARCCFTAKKEKQIFFSAAFAKKGSAKQKKLQINFVPLTPLREPHSCQTRGTDAACCPPPPLCMHHTPFCTLLHFQRMFNESGIRDQGIPDHESFWVLGYWIVVLLCPKADKVASSVCLGLWDHWMLDWCFAVPQS